MNDKWFDKKLQDLSQNPANHNPIPFNDEAWSKMELLLDKEEKKRRFIAWWWLLPAILAIAVGGYFFYSKTDKDSTTLTSNTLNNNSSKENNNTGTSSPSGNNNLNSATETETPAKDKEPGINDKSTPSLTGETKVVKEKSSGKQGDKTKSNGDVSNGGNTAAITPKAKPATDKVKIQKTFQKNNTNVDGSNVGKNGNLVSKAGATKNIGVIANAGNNKVIRDKPAGNNSDAGELKNNTVAGKSNPKLQTSSSDINNSPADKTVTVVNKTDVPVLPQVTPFAANNTNDKVNDTSAGKTAIVANTHPDSAKQKSAIDSSEKTITKEIKKKESFLSKFELSALVSGDISTVKFHNIDKISSAYGFGLSYAISKKLSISTGFAVSRKLYLADSTNYTYISANPMWKLSTVNANCLVYEVPLNLQYQLKEKGKNSWYAVAGLSSYFMKSEAYNYNLRYYNQTKVYDSLVVNQNNHLFGVLNLAVAYRRQFSKRWSYQLMPFVKVPLTGIGMGKVSLYSAGLQLSVNLKGK